jgi:hypothetical protein
VESAGKGDWFHAQAEALGAEPQSQGCCGDAQGKATNGAANYQHQGPRNMTLEWKHLAPARWRGSFKRQGQWLNRNCVRRLMVKMECVPVYPRLITSKPYPVHRLYPYRLHSVKITLPNRCGDVIYISVHRSFMRPITITTGILAVC